MRRDVDVVLRVVEQAAPGRRVGREPEAEERERRFRQDRTADADRRGHQHRAENVRDDVLHDDAAVGVADGTRRFDEFLLFQRQERGAHEARDGHPVQDPDDADDHEEDAQLGPECGSERVTEQVHDHQQQRQDRQREEQVREPHERTVELHEVASERADRQAQRDREQHGRDPHRDGHPSSEDRAREHVAAQIVGAEKMFRAGALERHGEVDVVDPRVVHERPDEDEDHERDERE